MCCGTSGSGHRVIDFFPYGYDERQYCAPGFDLPVGCFMRSQHGTFPEYHTSADNLTFVSSDKLEQSLETLWSVVQVVERDRVCLNLSPRGEPQLGKRGLYEGLERERRQPPTRNGAVVGAQSVRRLAQLAQHRRTSGHAFRRHLARG